MEHFSTEGGIEYGGNHHKDDLPLPELHIITPEPEIAPDADKAPPHVRQEIIERIEREEEEERRRERRIDEGEYSDPEREVPDAPPTIH